MQLIRWTVFQDTILSEESKSGLIEATDRFRAKSTDVETAGYPVSEADFNPRALDCSFLEEVAQR